MVKKRQSSLCGRKTCNKKCRSTLYRMKKWRRKSAKKTVKAVYRRKKCRPYKNVEFKVALTTIRWRNRKSNETFRNSDILYVTWREIFRFWE